MVHFGDGSFMCKIPSFGAFISGHTSNGLLTCGGQDLWDYCWRLINKQWRVMHRLIHPRWYHSSWESPRGVVLLGGKGSENSSEIVTFAKKSTEGFPLKHPIR